MASTLLIAPHVEPWRRWTSIAARKPTLDDGEDGAVLGISDWISTDTIRYSKVTNDRTVLSNRLEWTVTIDGEKKPVVGVGHKKRNGAYCSLSAPIVGAALSSAAVGDIFKTWAMNCI